MTLTADDRLLNLAKEFARLQLRPIQHVVRHEPVMTAEAAEAALNGDRDLIFADRSTVSVKNLVLKDKKKQMYLVTVESDKQVDLKLLAKRIPGAGQFRFASEDDVVERLSVARGSVTPLAIVNDTGAPPVVAVFSKVAAQARSILVHPSTNEATVKLFTEDVIKYCQSKGHSYLEVDLESADETEPAPAGKKANTPKAATSAVAKVESGSLMDIPKTAATFGDWYSQVVTRSEMIDYYDISGCYILRPWSYFIWEQIQKYFDTAIKTELGVKNSYFPLFVSEAALCKEKDHVEGFSAEVAWVTQAGDKSLDKRIAIRPTSETVMYPLMSKWIRSHRDLPMKLNQWSNVVRWEFKHPTPFIRSREFLWQEGHTAHATKPEADTEVRQVLDLYARVFEELLACPIVKGTKTEREKFAGALYTTTAEAFIPANGRGVQGATSHCLGQNFSKMFDIKFEDDKHERQFAWQNSWGLTTRSIGVMVMVHGDDKGLVLPPRIAPIQVVMVPIYFGDADNKALADEIESLAAKLSSIDLRVECDMRSGHTPRQKFAHWELKGVPIRCEIGPRDLKQQTVTCVRRDLGTRVEIRLVDATTAIPALLEQIQKEMLIKARAESDARLLTAMSWNEFIVALNSGNRVLIPFCEGESCEDDIKIASREQSVPLDKQANDDDAVAASSAEQAALSLSGAAKSLCIPFDQPQALSAGQPCIRCGEPAKSFTMFGRSY